MAQVLDGKAHADKLSQLRIACEDCHGKRYNRETLEILYRGKSIADILEITSLEEILKRVERISRKGKHQKGDTV